MLDQSELFAGVTIHESSFVDNPVKIGKGTKIWHFSHVSKGSEIGRDCVFGQNVYIGEDVRIGNRVKVQNNVSIYSGCVLEDEVFLGPSCVLTNVTNPRSQINRRSLYEKTLFRRGATVGANATIICGITIGRYAFIGAGAVVTRDVPDYALLVGNPARQYGWMSRHGHRLPEPDSNGVMVCPESGFRYMLKVDETSKTGIGNKSDMKVKKVMYCLDLDEESPLPDNLTSGTTSYREFKK